MKKGKSTLDEYLIIFFLFFFCYMYHRYDFIYLYLFEFESQFCAKDFFVHYNERNTNRLSSNQRNKPLPHRKYYLSYYYY